MFAFSRFAHYHDIFAVQLRSFRVPGDGNLPAANELIDWLSCQGTGKSRDAALRHSAFDVYVLGFQECGQREDRLVKRIQEVFYVMGLQDEMTQVRRSL